MKINSFFVKANTVVSKAAVEAPADGNRHDDRLDRSMEEAQPEKNLSHAEHDNGNISENVVKEVGRESSLAAPQLLQRRLAARVAAKFCRQGAARTTAAERRPLNGSQ